MKNKILIIFFLLTIFRLHSINIQGRILIGERDQNDTEQQFAISNISVTFINQTSANWEEAARKEQTLTENDGRYFLHDITGGNYKIQIIYPDGNTYSNTFNITIPSKESESGKYYIINDIILNIDTTTDNNIPDNSSDNN